jgi:hypothetical protein
VNYVRIELSTEEITKIRHACKERMQALYDRFSYSYVRRLENFVVGMKGELALCKLLKQMGKTPEHNPAGIHYTSDGYASDDGYDIEVENKKIAMKTKAISSLKQFSFADWFVHIPCDEGQYPKVLAKSDIVCFSLCASNIVDFIGWITVKDFDQNKILHDKQMLERIGSGLPDIESWAVPCSLLHQLENYEDFSLMLSGKTRMRTEKRFVLSQFSSSQEVA